MKDKLVKLRDELEDVNERIRTLKRERRYLFDNNRFVRRYVRCGQEEAELKSARNELNMEYTNLLQEKCDHPLWYIFDSKMMPGESKWIYSGICFDCLKVKMDFSSEFRNHIKVNNASLRVLAKDDYSFQNLIAKYNELKVAKPNLNYVSKAMIKKYNGR